VPYELLKRVDVELLHPSLVHRVVEMLSACRVAGFDYWAVSGFRSAVLPVACEQDRTRSRFIVTKARPFQSAHHFGLAADFLHGHDVGKPGLQAGWNPEDYEELGRQAHHHGLIWGGDYKLEGRPHVQLPGFTTPAELKPLEHIYLAARVHGHDARSRERSRLQTVWMHIDAADVTHV